MQANEDTLNKANPLQQAAGQVTGSVAPYLVGGEIPAAAKLLGMDATMGLGARVGLGAASQAAISGADAATRGGDLGQIAGSTALGAVGGVAGPLIGKGVGAVADKLGGILPGMAQKSVVDAAVANAPDRAALRSAGSQLFQSSVDTNPVMLNGNSYLDMLDGIQSATKGYRPTIENNPEAIGLLKKLYSVADDITASAPRIASTFDVVASTPCRSRSSAGSFLPPVSPCWGALSRPLLLAASSSTNWTTMSTGWTRPIRWAASTRRRIPRT